MAAALPAMAQDADETAEGNEIIVTATKRNVALQDVPFSINAQTAADIQKTGAGSLEDAPGVGHAELHALGLTDHEIAAAESHLAFVATLPQAFTPAVLGAGFVCDVLGAPAEALLDDKDAEAL